MERSKLHHGIRELVTDWPGDVPSHWEVCKLRHVLKLVSRRDRPELPLLSVVREKGVIVRDIASQDQNHNFIPDDLSNYKVVEKSQFAVNKMKAWQGSYGVSEHCGIVSPAYFVFDIQRADPSYFHRAMRSKPYVTYFNRASDGVRIGQWDLSVGAMREIPFLLPPIDEQLSIVRFLDHADDRIKRYIRAKEKLIALLEEQKQVVVHNAVTGRIDVRTGKPYPAYKPLGDEWLGTAPSHWDVLRLGNVINLTVGFPFKSEGFSQADGDIRLLRGINVAPGQLRWDDVVRWPASDMAEYAEFRLSIGDIILGMDRPIIGSGVRVAMVSEPDVPSLLLQRVARIRPIEKRLSRKFAIRLLSGASFSGYLVSNLLWDQRTSPESRTDKGIPYCIAELGRPRSHRRLSRFNRGSNYMCDEPCPISNRPSPRIPNPLDRRRSHRQARRARCSRRTP